MSWKERFRSIRTIDAHTGGEPLRLIVDGLPKIEGQTVLEKRAFLKAHHDHLRTALMFEPRGHADMYGAILTDPETPDGDYGVIFLHNEGYSTMCGHGVIAIATILLETGMHAAGGEGTELKLDTPAGRVVAQTRMARGRVESVSFLNVPSFVFRRGVMAQGAVFDLVYGGAFYAVGEAAALGLEVKPSAVEHVIRAGRAVKAEITEKEKVEHPFESDLGFLYGTIFTGPPETPGNHSRNVCVFAEGEVDRSPTGTGVSARASLLYANGEIGLGEPVTIESIVGSTFTVEAVEEVQFGPYDAIVPRVTGSAHITGEHEFLIDPNDPFKDGFLVR